MSEVTCDCGRVITVYLPTNLRYVKLENLLKIRNNGYEPLSGSGLYNAMAIEKEIDRKRERARTRLAKFKG